MFKRKTNDALLSSKLYNQDSFYRAFEHDLGSCKKELVIESPFITTKRVAALLPVFQRLIKHGVRIVVNTRDPEEHDQIYRFQAEEAIEALQSLDITVLYTTRHHRKLALIDKSIIWEGSLNILSHNDSCEIMRRISSVKLAEQLINFTQINKYLVS